MQTDKNKSDTEILFKFVLIGDSGVGKSCILHNFIHNKCIQYFKSVKKDSDHTIGVEFGSKFIHIGDKEIKLQIWDTAGQEKFKSVAKSYYRNSLGVIIVYDITKQESFLHVENWLNEIKNTAKSECCICVVGNKSDLKDQRVIKYNEGANFCQKNNVSHFECSALTNENIQEIFLSCSKQILSKVEQGIIEESLVMSGIKNFVATNNDILNESKSSQCSC